MWTKLSVTDVALIDRWTQIMRLMNGNYSKLKAAEIRGGMATTLGETWYYRNERGEVAVRFEFIAKRRSYQLHNVGFVGVLEPAEALDLVVERCKCFMLEHQIKSLIALRPKNMDHPGIEAFHRLVPSHPKVVVVMDRDTPRIIMWELSHCDVLREGSYTPVVAAAAS